MGTITAILKTTPSILRQASTTYFQPHKAISEIAYPNKKELAKHEITINNKKYSWLQVLSKSMCYNQGAFLQYSFLAAERHKLIKDEFRNKNIDTEKINWHMQDLMNFLNKGLFEHTFQNFRYLRLFYLGRSSQEPRFCIKGNFRTQNRDTVVSVFRNKKVPYYSDCEIEKNTGFFSILKTGKYYLNNSLPDSVLAGSYSNPRLKNECSIFLKQQKKKSFYNLLPVSRKEKDNLWATCWKDFESGSGESSSFYKSTLIIPMTLWNSDLSEDFKKRINIKNVDRVIFGFLCLDHVDENYFDEETDVPVGYYFADIISMFLLTRLIYTEISDTFRNVEKYLDKSIFEETLEKIDIEWKKLASLPIEANSILKQVSETDNNQLYSIDESLAQYVSSHTEE
ncbi:MAG: hypothetical protein FP815_09865 [Desulfobulbaceae bacterium]|nr:hypothetical protein [Desulfobulbaceae bacterium]